MADFRFYLKDKKADIETQIRLHIHYNNQVARTYIGEKIHPDHWNAERMRAKSTKKFPEHPEFNERLEGAMLAGKLALDSLRSENGGAYPLPKELARRVRIELGLEEGREKLSLFQYFEKRVREEESRLKTQGKLIHSGSFPKGLQRTMELLKEYEADRNVQLTYNSVDLELYYDFCDYMRDEREYKVNTMGKHIKLLKNVMKTAFAEGLHSNTAYTHPKFKILEEEAETIYLDEDDLELLENLDLASYPGLNRARDLFLAGCWSGARFSDWTKLSYENVQGDDIVLKAQKTGKDVRIPILDPLKKLLDKYADSQLPTFTNQAINRSLKELGKKMMEKSKLKSLVADTSKYVHISTHTARRSFATNLYRRGVPIESIMQVTGHKTQQEFFKYIRVTPGEHANTIRQFFPNTSTLIRTAK